MQPHSLLYSITESEIKARENYEDLGQLTPFIREYKTPQEEYNYKNKELGIIARNTVTHSLSRLFANPSAYD